MTKTLFFYDLETTGFDRANDRIMQFAGQRTDLDLQPIGEPYNFLIRLNKDVLPSPSAISITGITPQKTIEEGYSEAEAVKILVEEIFTPDTTVIGYNNVRFDDEFIRYLFWRNYVDAYAWAYADGRSRWDLLDLTRLVRAIRPQNINWPVDDEGNPTNRLELLSKANNLEHAKAHDAMSDVEALIGLTKLIKEKQPKMFQYLFDLRHKNKVNQLVNLDNPKPFVYASGRLDKNWQKTSIFYPISQAQYGNLLVYNLRFDPTPFIGKTAKQIIEYVNQQYYDKEFDRVESPVFVKELKVNRCPAIAPIGVLDKQAWDNIKLDLATVNKHLEVLKKSPSIVEAFSQIFAEKAAAWQDKVVETNAEVKLYDGFVDNQDKYKMSEIYNLAADKVGQYQPDFIDNRLNDLWLGYKARSFGKSLTDQERAAWQQRINDNIAQNSQTYLEQLEQLAQSDNKNDQFYAEELKLWLESLIDTDV